ncbi:hypothetical protein CXB51_032337 [Gossypium anomalum]|uniref:RING-type domain-containing protein n=1 Tax=Gossypium anomalum TaxID=47600 RepID=A0A8J5Y7V9_9ROSI|nr:hypothetical protein CXB51_032337 [Gossypium anomalum]
MGMVYYQLSKSSYQDFLKILKADIQHANALAAAIPRAKSGAHLQMKLVYNHLAPLFLFLLQWMDSSCICLLPRFLNLFHILVYKVHYTGLFVPLFYIYFHTYLYAPFVHFHIVCYRSIQMGDQIYLDVEGKQQLESFTVLYYHLFKGSMLDDDKEAGGSSAKKRVDLDNRLGNIDFEREDECGICLEPCTKMVLPNCCHAMNTKSESCPFCRGSLKRVNSEDLWVLTCNDDVVDNKTVSQEDLLRFYLYINSLPKDFPDALFLVYYEYLI